MTFEPLTKGQTPVSWYHLLSELLDLGSFSNLWFWIVLAVMWSSASHFVLGVPYDMVSRARRGDEVARENLRLLALIRAERMTYIAHVSGTFLVALISFMLTGLAVLGFGYGVEFSQAVFLLGFPTFIVSVMNLRLAARVMGQQPDALTLCGWIGWQRFLIQMIGMLSITITVLWGMYQNISVGVLGH